jgi:protein TonB
MTIDLPRGIVFALLAHAAVILIGGFLLVGSEVDHASLQQVELFSENEVEAEKEVEEQTPEEVEIEAEEVPDAAEIIESLEAKVDDAPALEAASLSDIEAALSGAGGGSGDFANALDFASGGRIGGTGRAGSFAGEDLSKVFSLTELDQRPRPIFQAAPVYPARMRSKKTQATVSIVFVVDANGKVSEAKVEDSTHPAYDKSALDAVKQWKFEPGIKSGQRVACKMRVPIRFQPKS